MFGFSTGLAGKVCLGASLLGRHASNFMNLIGAES